MLINYGITSNIRNRELWLLLLFLSVADSGFCLRYLNSERMNGFFIDSRYVLTDLFQKPEVLRGKNMKTKE